MAWSNGNILYRFPFKSLNETSCRIDVYVRGYTGESFFTLPAADNPFFFEEDNDSDLLNTVMRYRTGYIRVVEEENSPITDIYPTQAFDRYVEVYYGTTLIFNGYIQVQDFYKELTPTPHILELAVISPLGLMETKTFKNYYDYQPVSEVTLGELLDYILYGTYSNVYFPKNYGYPNQVGFGMKVSTLVVMPWNKDFHYSMTSAPASHVMKGVSYSYLIEAICKAFGWICHDTPDTLVFTAFDYDGVYSSFPVGHIGEAGYSTDLNIPSGVATLLDYFSEADNNANEQTIQPDTGIEISYEGESGDRFFDLTHTFLWEPDPVVIEPSFIPDGYAFPNHAEIFSLCSLSRIPSLYETDIAQKPSFYGDSSQLNIGVYMVAWHGSRGVMVSIDGDDPSGTTLFYVRFYFRRFTGQYFSLTYDMIAKKNGAIGALAMYSPDENMDYYISTSLDTSHDDYVQATFRYRHGTESSDYPPLPDRALFFISNIRLEVCEHGVPYEEYLYKPASDTDIIGPDGDVSTLTTGDLNPSVSSKVTMPISMYRFNDHMIGESLRSTKVTLYPYLFQPRKELTGRFRLTSAPTFPYMRMFSYLSKNYRIIAQRFNPWNDEVKLTLQHSPIFNT